MANRMDESVCTSYGKDILVAEIAAGKKFKDDAEIYDRWNLLAKMAPRVFFNVQNQFRKLEQQNG